MQSDERQNADEPLPLTLRFVMTMGAAFFVGWILMFWLFKGRW